MCVCVEGKGRGRVKQRARVKLVIRPKTTYRLAIPDTYPMVFILDVTRKVLKGRPQKKKTQTLVQNLSGPQNNPPQKGVYFADRLKNVFFFCGPLKLWGKSIVSRRNRKIQVVK